VTVGVESEPTAELIEAVVRLVPQLSPGREPPSRLEIAELLEADETRLVVARDGDEIVGMLTLVLYRVPTGLKGRIEDVVVDESARGRGVGGALSRAALDAAVEAGARSVELTSRPSREAANRLYRRLGFEQRETNVYAWRPR
jgi:ribosomal protein S18 acetylase RimI-like enzyme